MASSSAGRVVLDLGAVRLKNISMDGIGLLVSKQVEAGNTLGVTIANKKKSVSKTMLVSVAHVTATVGGSYLIGGTFETPLTYQELSALIM